MLRSREKHYIPAILRHQCTSDFFIAIIKSWKELERAQTTKSHPFHSVRHVRAARSRVWPRHRSLRVSPPDLRRALRPMQTWCMGSRTTSRLQTVRLHPGRHAIPLRSSGSVSVQDRLRRPQMREVCPRLLRLSEVSTLRLQLGRHDAVSGRYLWLRREGTVPLQGK